MEEALNEELQQASLFKVNILDVLRLRDNLSPVEDCNGPSLENWDTKDNDSQLRKLIQNRLDHLRHGGCPSNHLELVNNASSFLLSRSPIPGKKKKKGRVKQSYLRMRLSALLNQRHPQRLLSPDWRCCKKPSGPNKDTKQHSEYGKQQASRSSHEGPEANDAPLADGGGSSSPLLSRETRSPDIIETQSACDDAGTSTRNSTPLPTREQSHSTLDANGSHQPRKTAKAQCSELPLSSSNQIAENPETQSASCDDAVMSTRNSTPPPTREQSHSILDANGSQQPRDTARAQRSDSPPSSHNRTAGMSSRHKGEDTKTPDNPTPPHCPNCRTRLFCLNFRELASHGYECGETSVDAPAKTVLQLDERQCMFCKALLTKKYGARRHEKTPHQAFACGAVIPIPLHIPAPSHTCLWKETWRCQTVDFDPVQYLMFPRKTDAPKMLDNVPKAMTSVEILQRAVATWPALWVSCLVEVPPETLGTLLKNILVAAANPPRTIAGESVNSGTDCPSSPSAIEADEFTGPAGRSSHDKQPTPPLSDAADLGAGADDLSTTRDDGLSTTSPSGATDVGAGMRNETAIAMDTAQSTDGAANTPIKDATEPSQTIGSTRDSPPAATPIQHSPNTDSTTDTTNHLNLYSGSVAASSNGASSLCAVSSASSLMGPGEPTGPLTSAIPPGELHRHSQGSMNSEEQSTAPPLTPHSVGSDPHPIATALATNGSLGPGYPSKRKRGEMSETMNTSESTPNNATPDGSSLMRKRDASKPPHEIRRIGNSPPVTPTNVHDVPDVSAPLLISGNALFDHHVEKDKNRSPRHSVPSDQTQAASLSALVNVVPTSPAVPSYVRSESHVMTPKIDQTSGGKPPTKRRRLSEPGRDRRYSVTELAGHTVGNSADTRDLPCSTHSNPEMTSTSVVPDEPDALLIRSAEVTSTACNPDRCSFPMAVMKRQHGPASRVMNSPTSVTELSNNSHLAPSRTNSTATTVNQPSGADVVPPFPRRQSLCSKGASVPADSPNSILASTNPGRSGSALIHELTSSVIGGISCNVYQSTQSDTIHSKSPYPALVSDSERTSSIVLPPMASLHHQGAGYRNPAAQTYWSSQNKPTAFQLYSSPPLGDMLPATTRNLGPNVPHGQSDWYSQPQPNIYSYSGSDHYISQRISGDGNSSSRTVTIAQPSAADPRSAWHRDVVHDRTTASILQSDSDTRGTFPVELFSPWEASASIPDLDSRNVSKEREGLSPRLVKPDGTLGYPRAVAGKTPDSTPSVYSWRPRGLTEETSGKNFWLEVPTSASDVHSMFCELIHTELINARWIKDFRMTCCYYEEDIFVEIVLSPSIEKFVQDMAKTNGWRELLCEKVIEGISDSERCKSEGTGVKIKRLSDGGDILVNFTLCYETGVEYVQQIYWK